MSVVSGTILLQAYQDVTACRGTLAPRSGLTADYDADKHMGPVSGSTPTAAEVCQLQAAAFQAVLNHQEARKHAPPTALATATHASEHTAVVPNSAVVLQCHADRAVHDGHAEHAGHAAHAALSLERPLSADVANNGQEPLLAFSIPSAQQPLPSVNLQVAHTAGSDVATAECAIDADDIQLETGGGEADGTTCLLPCSEEDHAEGAPSSSLNQQASASALSWNVAATAVMPADTGDNPGAVADAADSSGCLAAVADVASTSGRLTGASQAGGQKYTHLDTSDLCIEDTIPQTYRQQDNVNSSSGLGNGPVWSRDTHEQSLTAGLTDHSGHVRESDAPPWYQHGPLTASTAASDSSHDTLHDMPASLIAAAQASATNATAAAIDLEQETSVTGVSTSLHSLGHFHVSSPYQHSSAGVGEIASPPLLGPHAPAGPPPIDPPPDAQQQESDSSAAKGNTAAAEKQPTVSRVMSKLHSLQSMTNR